MKELPPFICVVLGKFVQLELLDCPGRENNVAGISPNAKGEYQIGRPRTPTVPAECIDAPLDDFLGRHVLVEPLLRPFQKAFDLVRRHINSEADDTRFGSEALGIQNGKLFSRSASLCGAPRGLIPTVLLEPGTLLGSR